MQQGQTPNARSSTVQQRLRRWIDRPGVEAVVGALIVVSVVLTVLEFAVTDSPWSRTIIEVNYSITLLFAVELTVRFAAARSKAAFFRHYWTDLLSLLPLLRTLPAARYLRLLRLLRILRLLGIFSRYASSFPYIFRRGAVEYVIVCGLIVLTVLFATGALLSLEGNRPETDTFAEAFWFSIYTILSGEPIPSLPVTVAGRFVAVGVMFMGMTIFAMFTGTVSAFMVERLRMEGRIVQWEDFHDHAIICGWNRKTEIIVREYLESEHKARTPIVVIAELDGEPDASDTEILSKVQFLNDDFTKISALQKAGISRAATCIILSDTSRGRTDQDADARTILAALTIERLNPNVYTCGELHNREYGSHLDMGGVDDYVVSDEHSGFLLAQAALNQGLIGLFSELLTQTHGNQFYRVPVPKEHVGKPFLDLFVELKHQRNAILVAVHESDGTYQVNPSDYKFKGDEHLIVISRDAWS